MADTASGHTKDLADALAERALARAGGGLAAAGTVLGLVAAMFLVTADGTLDARTLPPFSLLATGQVLGLTGAGLALLRLRTVRARPGSGPGTAAAVAGWMSRLVVAVPVSGLAIGVVLVAVVEPRTTVLFSAAVSLLVLCQLSVAAAVLRRGLGRAARAG